MKASSLLKGIQITLSILCPVFSIAAFMVYQLVEHKKEKKLMERYFAIAGDSCAKTAYVLEKTQPKIPSESKESEK